MITFAELEEMHTIVIVVNRGFYRGQGVPTYAFIRVM